MKNRISINEYVSGITRIEGSVLDGVEVLDWQKPDGRKLWYLNEVGEISSKKIVGLIKVSGQAVNKADPATAIRASITNSLLVKDDLEEFERSGIMPLLKTFWLGVACRRSYANNLERKTPKWARGYEIIEAEDPSGCFAALGYSRFPGFEHCKDFYTALLVHEYNPETGRYDDSAVTSLFATAEDE